MTADGHCKLLDFGALSTFGRTSVVVGTAPAIPPETLQRVTLLRRTLTQMNPVQAMEMLVKKLGETPSNAAFLDRIAMIVK